ncbi:hypothetical protein [Tepidiphilus sp. J10]|uniref:hypothetical protein n=1 Tax=Tepidiphilus sp. J10 TaxID=2502185 RepID=UPI00115E1724|nr:hypothetical protein [Tepidiphilus sp. J10]
MRWRRGAIAALCALGLAACEDAAIGYRIAGMNHALVLERQQPFPWSEVKQAVVVSRLPQCQRKYPIAPDRAEMTPMKVYEAGDLLWALEQGDHWYLASTEDCRLQPWDKPDPQALGTLVGTFRHRDGVLVFESTLEPAS